jgi:glycosyltransferase involved in cell wall biosynthesis
MTTIGVDARWLNNYYTGIGKFTFGLISGLASFGDDPYSYVLMVEGGASDASKHLWSSLSQPKFTTANLPFEHMTFLPAQLRMLFQDQCAVPLAARRSGCKFMLFPYFNVPVIDLHRSIVTITDLDLYLHRSSHSWYKGAYYNAVLNLASRRALSFIAISEATKKDAVRLLGINPELIDVVYPTIRSVFFQVDRTQAKAMCRSLFGIDRPFVLYTGGFSSRKNVPNLIRAFEKASGWFPGE